MAHDARGRIAIVYPGDYADRTKATAENNRFADLFRAFAAEGIYAEPAVYRDDFCTEVHDQLMQVDAVLVWVNPIHDGHDRSVLGAMLREVAAAGIFVSAHPDVILKLGTKEVLYRTRDIGWGCATRISITAWTRCVRNCLRAWQTAKPAYSSNTAAMAESACGKFN